MGTASRIRVIFIFSLYNFRYLSLKPEYIINDLTFVNGPLDNEAFENSNGAITLISLLEVIFFWFILKILGLY